MRATGACTSSRTSLRQPHGFVGRLLARRPVHRQRARVVLAAAHAAVDGPEPKRSHVSDDAATTAARQLVAAVRHQQEGSSALGDSTVEGEATAAVGNGATADGAGINTAAEGANDAAAGTDSLQEQKHSTRDGAQAAAAASVVGAAAAAEAADATDAAEEEGALQAEAADEGANEEHAAAAADQGGAGEAGAEQDTADLLQQISSSIAPALARFGMDDLLVPQLQRHLQRHGKFKRSFHSYTIYVSSTCLLCDPRVYGQWSQGALTCYLLTLWLLGVEQLPLQENPITKWHRQGPTATSTNKGLVMQMSIAGDFLAAVRSRFAGKPRSINSRDDKAPITTRTLLIDCPWMQLSRPSGDAAENRLTLSLQLLGVAASKAKLAELLPLLNDAVCTAFGVNPAGAAASAGLVAAVAAEAVGTKDARRIRQGILAAAARSAVRYYMNASPAKLGRMRYMLQHGVPVGVLNLVRFIQDSSPVGQKDKVQGMTGELAAALEDMLATAKPYWVCLRPPASPRSSSSSSSSSQNSIWLFDLPLLLQENAALRESAAHLLPATRATASSTTAAAAAAERMEATAEKQQVAGAAAAASRQQRLAALSKIAAAGARCAVQPAAVAAAPVPAEAEDSAPAPAMSSLDSMPAAAASALHSFAATRGRADAAHSKLASAASRSTAGFTTAQVYRAAASARLAALYGPHQEAKRGPAAGLDYQQRLPGLGPVQVVSISSAGSAAYSSMLQHMAGVSLLGMDTESSWLGSEGSVTALLNFMAPAVPASGSDPGWPDTVYIIDLVAAAMQQPSSSSGDSSQAAETAAASAVSDLVAGLAAVFDDPGCTLVVQDASQDLPLLQAEFGLSPVNVIDTQLCHIVLGAVRQQQGLHVQGQPLMRRKLEVLLQAYGLSHPNKMHVVALSRANHMLWLTAPRPLSAELLSYLVADVRYLPALVLLMERDLLQASPGALMRELQPALPRRLQPPLARSSTSLLQSTAQQLMQQQQQEKQGIVALPDGGLLLPAVAPGASSSSSSNSNTCTNSSWIEPGADDTVVSNLVFMLPNVELSGTSHGQLQQLLRSPGKPSYQLLIPAEAEAAAEQAVVAAAAALGAAAGVQAPGNAGDAGLVHHQQQQQQQRGQGQLQHLDSDSSCSSSTEWHADPASEHLLGLLPDRLATALRSNMAAAAASFVRRQAALRNAAAAGADAAAAAAVLPLTPQLVQLHIVSGSAIMYRLGVSGVDAAAASSSSSLLGMQEQLFELKLPRDEALSLGLTPYSRCSGELLVQCVETLWHLQTSQGGEHADGAAASKAHACNLLFGSLQRRRRSGLMHCVAPLAVPDREQQRHASLPNNSSGSSGSSSDCNDCVASGELPPGTAPLQQHQQPPQHEGLGMEYPKGLLFSALRRPTGISHVINDLLASITQRALTVNALGGVTHCAPLQLAAALQLTWLHTGPGSGGKRLRGSSGTVQAGNGHTLAQPQQGGTAMLRQHQLGAAWQLGLQPASFKAAADATFSSSSSSSRRPGSFVLLLGPCQSGKSSMLQDAAAALADNSCVSVAAVDMHGRLAGAHAVQARLLGRALQLPVDSAASQAAAVQSAWQLHRCHVIVINSLSSKALPAVQAALAAGVSVVAAANGFADLAALHESSGASTAVAAGASGSTGNGSISGDGNQEAAAALWKLLNRLCSDGSGQSCSVVECLPGYRWIVHKQLARSLQLLQQSPAADPSAAAAEPAGHTAVLPVQLRQFMPAGATGVPAAAAVDSAGQLLQQQTGTSAFDGNSSDGNSSDSSSNGKTAVEHAGGVIVVSRFASYSAAAGDLPLSLLGVVRELLYGQGQA